MMQSQYHSPSQAAAPALEYAGVGRRFLAFIIDRIIFFIVAEIKSLISPSSGVMTTSGDFAHRLAHLGLGGVLNIIFIIIFFVYYIVMEAMLGATVGKMVLGIRVVKLDGLPISWEQSIVRNLFRFADLLSWLLSVPYLLAALLIWTSPRQQRLGDRVARTVVVRRSSSKNASQNFEQGLAW